MPSYLFKYKSSSQFDLIIDGVRTETYPSVYHPRQSAIKGRVNFVNINDEKDEIFSNDIPYADITVEDSGGTQTTYTDTSDSVNEVALSADTQNISYVQGGGTGTGQTAAQVEDQITARMQTDIRANPAAENTKIATEKSVRDALDSLSFVGLYKGSSNTVAGLPAGVNGDWAILTAVDAANLPGIYVTDGTTYSLAKSIPELVALTDIQVLDETVTDTGTITPKQVYDAIIKHVGDRIEYYPTVADAKIDPDIQADRLYYITETASIYTSVLGQAPQFNDDKVAIQVSNGITLAKNNNEFRASADPTPNVYGFHYFINNNDPDGGTYKIDTPFYNTFGTSFRNASLVNTHTIGFEGAEVFTNPDTTTSPTITLNPGERVRIYRVENGDIVYYRDQDASSIQDIQPIADSTIPNTDPDYGTTGTTSVEKKQPRKH